MIPTSKLPDTGTTIFTVMSRMAQEYGAINLSQGFPDFRISTDLMELVRDAMYKDQNQYAPMQGLPALREAISNKLDFSYSIDVDPDEEITVTAGATEALFSAIAALVHNGDEVIVLDPAYDSYDPAIRLCGGVPVHVDLAQPDFHVDWEKVREYCTDKTRMIIVNTPHNPTGAVFSSKDLDELENLLSGRDMYILSDEVYEHLIYEGMHHQSMLTRPFLRERSVSVFSFGKTFHATGWKIGYAVAPPQLTEEIRRIHQYLTFSVNTPMQAGLAAFLQNPKNYIGLAEFFERKRNMFLAQLEKSRFKPVKCSGTYFQLASYEDISDEKDTELAERLVKEYKLAAIPISVFYQDGKDDKLLRFCFAKKDDTLLEAGEILCRI